MSVEPAEPSSTRAGAARPAGDLPYRAWWPFAVGALIGLLLRFVFSGEPGGPYATMMSSFVLLVPLLVGAATVYVAEWQGRRTWGYYAWAPVVANALFVFGTLLVLIEGLICAVLILPLFCGLGAIGGLLMGAVCRWTNWPRRAMYSLVALPLLLGGFEHELPLPMAERTLEGSRFIAASPREVWRQIENPVAIEPHEVRDAWVYRIGVPLPVAGRTVQGADGVVREIRMGKGIRFDEVAVVWEPERHVRWANRFTDDSFPPGTMDEHVKIGGRYFGIGDTDYVLTPVGAGTELRMTVRYRLSTSFNVYAVPVVDLLVRNFEDVILAFYARRAEAAAASVRR